MQIKHDILAQRTDELDKDCQELRDQLAEAEDHNEDLQNKLQQVQGERKELQSNLQKEKVRILKGNFSLYCLILIQPCCSGSCSYCNIPA